MGRDPCALSVSFQDQQAAWTELINVVNSYGFNGTDPRWTLHSIPNYVYNGEENTP